jgi:trigger factor
MVVELPVEDVEAEYRKIIEEFIKFSQIPGFRKGRAPLTLVESHYSKKIWEETKDRLIGRSYPEAIKQSKLNPVMIIDLKAEAEPKKPLVYRVILDMPPEFKLPKYKNIAVPAKPVNVTDDDLQKAVDRFLERMATTEPVTDRPVRKGDLAQVDYTRKDQVPANQSDPLAAGHNFWMAVGENDSFLPGFSDALEGMAIGGRKDITIRMPADFKIAELAGKQVEYGVQLKAIHQRKLPVMNEEFFKSVGVQSETDLRDKMKSTLLEEGQRLDKERRKNEIIDYLLKHADLDLPESIVQEETRHMYATIVRERLMRGSTREQLATQKEELLTAATKTAADKVKLGYILHKIGEEEKISVEEAEVERGIQDMAQRYRMAPEELKKELEAKNEMDALRHEIRMGKVLDFILASAGTEEQGGIISRLFNKKEGTPATVAK